MSTPVKIILTAETELAAARLKAFVESAGSGLKSLTPAAAHAGGELTKVRESALLAREGFHALELGAVSLGAGKLPMLGEAVMGLRLGMMSARTSAQLFGLTLAEVALPLTAVAAAIAGAVYIWHEYSSAEAEAAEATRKNVEELNKVPALIEKINLLKKAGLISDARAKELQDEATGKTKYYKKSDGSLTTDSTEDVETPVYIYTAKGAIPTGKTRTDKIQLAEATQAEINADLGNQTPAAAEEQAKAVVKNKELVQQAHNELLAGVKKEEAAIHEKYEKQRQEILLTAQQSGKLMGAHQLDAAQNGAITDLNSAEARDIVIAQQKAADDLARKQAELEAKWKTEAARAFAEQSQKLEDQITTKQETDGALRGQFAQEEFKQRTELAYSFYLLGILSEDQYTHKIEEAQKKRVAGEKEYTAELAKTAAIKQETARAEIEAKLKSIQGNPFLTASEKRDQSLPLMQEEQILNAERIIKLQAEAAKNPAQRIEAEKEINRLLAEQGDLANKIAAQQNPWRTMFTQLRSQAEINMTTLAATFKSIFDSAISSISAGITGLIEGTKTWGQALRQIYNSIINEIVQSFVHMVVQWIMTHTLMAAVSRLFTAQDVATHTAGEVAKTGATATGASSRGGIRLMETVFHGLMVAARVAAHIAGEIASTAATLAQAALRAIAWGISAIIGAISAVASIPYVGPILAVAAAAGMAALVASEIHGFADGGRPPVGQLSLVGERGPELFIPDQSGTIINHDQTVNLLRGASHNSGGSGGAVMGGVGKSNISVYGFTDPDQMAEHLQRNDDHEKWVVDVMRRNVHRFR